MSHLSMSATDVSNIYCCCCWCICVIISAEQKKFSIPSEFLMHCSCDYGQCIFEYHHGGTSVFLFSNFESTFLFGMQCSSSYSHLLSLCLSPPPPPPPLLPALLWLFESKGSIVWIKGSDLLSENMGYQLYPLYLIVSVKGVWHTFRQHGVSVNICSKPLVFFGSYPKIKPVNKLQTCRLQKCLVSRFIYCL